MDGLAVLEERYPDEPGRRLEDYLRKVQAERQGPVSDLTPATPPDPPP
jgi:hypothetical protein